MNLLDYNNAAPIENFLNQIISWNFFSVVTHPTCVTLSTSTVIDNIFCNRVDDIEATNVITTNISDHFSIFSSEKTPSLAKDVIKKYEIFPLYVRI